MTAPRRARRSILPPPEARREIGQYLADRVTSAARTRHFPVHLDEPLRVNGIALGDELETARRMAPTFTKQVDVHAVAEPSDSLEAGAIVSVDGYALGIGADGIVLDWHSTTTLKRELERSLGPARRLSFWNWAWELEHRGHRSTLVVSCDRPPGARPLRPCSAQSAETGAKQPFTWREAALPLLPSLGEPRVVHCFPRFLHGSTFSQLSDRFRMNGVERGLNVNGIAAGMSRDEVVDSPGVSVEFQQDPFRQCPVVITVGGPDLYVGQSLLTKVGDLWSRAIRRLAAHGINPTLGTRTHTTVLGREHTAHSAYFGIWLDAPVEANFLGLVAISRDPVADRVSRITAQAFRPSTPLD